MWGLWAFGVLWLSSWGVGLKLIKALHPFVLSFTPSEFTSCAESDGHVMGSIGKSCCDEDFPSS
jgi:hypothetical protein